MYIKNTLDFREIPENYKQIFQNSFSNNIAKNELIRMKNEGKITDRDLEILKFLFKFRSATLYQIIRYLGEGTSETGIRSRLEKLIQYRVVNKFMLSETGEGTIQGDALVIYCLDIGGKYILKNYSSEDTIDWSIADNMKTSGNVSRELITTDFYLRVLKECPEKIIFFNPFPELRNGRSAVIPSFEMCLKVEDSEKYFIGEIVRNYDLPENYRQKSIKLEKILITNAWKKYYLDTEKPPVLFLFVDTVESAIKVGNITNSVTRIDAYRLSTVEDMLNLKEKDDFSLSKQVFLKYLPETKKLKYVSAKVFSTN